jgi:hypothetical protein
VTFISGKRDFTDEADDPVSCRIRPIPILIVRRKDPEAAGNPPLKLQGAMLRWTDV